MPALALTDTNNLFGALEFSDKLSAAAACSRSSAVTLQSISTTRKAERPYRGMPASACRAAPDGFDRAAGHERRRLRQPHEARLPAPILSTAEDEAPHIKIGLAAAAWRGPHRADRRPRARSTALARRARTRERKSGCCNPEEDLRRPALRRDPAARPQARDRGRAALLELAYARDLPIVATNEVYFASPDDYEAHDALMCIAEGRYVIEDDRRRLSREHFFKTAEQMAQAVRRPAGGAGQHDRDRQALRLPAEGAQADPAALRADFAMARLRTSMSRWSG